MATSIFAPCSRFVDVSFEVLEGVFLCSASRFGGGLVGDGYCFGLVFCEGILFAGFELLVGYGF